VPFGPLTDSMLLKTDKSMVGPAFQIFYNIIIQLLRGQKGPFYETSAARRKNPVRARGHDKNNNNNVMSAGGGDSAG